MSKRKVLIHTHRGTLTPTSQTAPARVRIDEAARLREIRALVITHNRSTLSTNRIICQIYKESTFDANAGVGKHGALGLMQMQRPGVMQVYKYRLQQQLGHMPSDAATHQAFAQAAVVHDSHQIVDEATNIQIGTEYMQYWLNTTPNEETAYFRYRGNAEAYYQPIRQCAEQLDADPDNVQILHQLHSR